MIQSEAAPRLSSRAPYFDWAGFLALSIAPAVAIYQGVVAALGIFAPFDTSVQALISIVVILGCLVWRLPALRKSLSIPSVGRATVYLMGYLLIVLTSTLLVYLDPIERDPTRMTQQYLSTIPMVLTFFVMVASPAPAAAIRGFQACLLIWFIAAVLTPLTALTPLPIGEVQGTYVGARGLRSFGVLGDAGTFVVSFLAVAYFSSRRLFWFLLSIFALVLSGSRMALIVAGAGIALVLVLAGGEKRSQARGERAVRMMLAMFVLLFLLLGLQFVFSQVSEQFGIFNAFDRLRETEIGESDRLFSIMQGLEWFQSSPFFGHGFNSYYYFSLTASIFGANVANSLNQVVQTLMDGGILALLFLVLFFVQVVWPRKGHSLIDRQKDPYALRAWLLAFLVVNQTAVYILPASYLTALVFGLAGLSLYLEVSSRPTAATPVAKRHNSQLPAA